MSSFPKLGFKNQRYLSVAVGDVLVWVTSVTPGVSVTECCPGAPLLTVGRPVVGPKLTACSLVWDETISVPSSF